MRPKIVTITATSPSAASPNAPSTGIVGGLSGFDALTIIGSLQGGTGGTLDVYLQTSYDGGTTWYDYAHWPQLADSDPLTMREWSVNRSTAVTASTTIGSGLAPALGVDTILGGAWGDMMRLLFDAGAGTSAGAAQSVTIIGQAITR
jgi:hypothetical protein